MAKVFIEETTLTAIGDAIRDKEGTTELVPVTAMATRITNLPSGGGGSEDIPKIVLTDSCGYACAGNLAGEFIENFPNKVSTNNITSASYMFYMNGKITRVPFEINISKGSDMTSFFQGCNRLIEAPTIDCKQTNYAKMTSFFSYCNSLQTVSPLLNVYPADMSGFFNQCANLRSIPDDFFSDWNMTRIQSYSYSDVGSIFSGCNRLRAIPSSLFEKFKDGWASTSSYSGLYNQLCNYCYVLDEVVGLPVNSVTYTSNALTNTFSNCNRLKRLTFRMNDDGTPKTANWKAQTLDFTQYVGWAQATYNVLGSGGSSGIPAGKEVTDDATYQALKNDPDWWTLKIEYSRYNHDSAVETINSLPDTSEYLTATSGTNTIKFKGTAGSATDGGAINTLTAEEIAVATAKGWTVTFA